ncbi:erythromycin esterase family protein [Pontibacter sp. E15-1]|uniref:erythromycin esterase family protein n=1 Tax=Pontibacter sp. E15-1 TaxID=2919918 RepID=UPI001F4F5E84|nr:erythromycin esterase family protein [Pontibacter sp. E15-1]MCJ8163701.1 erythromycin esterase family protein [Pontibacter sp. E15-1]
MFKMLCFLLFITGAVNAQDITINWVNKNAYPLQADSSSSNYHDLRFLSKVLKDKSIIGLGEASHGTQEFYYQKRRIVEYLIQEAGYKMVALESPSTTIEPINQFLQDGTGDMKVMLKAMGLYNSEEMYKLCLWIMTYNKNKSDKDKVKLIGYDSEEYWGNPFTRDKLMAESLIKARTVQNCKTIVWAHNLHIAKDTTMAEFKAMGYYLKKEFGINFYAIGFDTYKGSVNVLNNGELEKHYFKGNEDTFSSLFAKAIYPSFFIDFTTQGNPFINTVNKITNIYSNWKEPNPLPIRPGYDFEGLIFVKETSASIGIK